MAKSYRFDPKAIEIKAGQTRHLDERRQLHAHGPGRRPARPQGRPRRQRLDPVRQARHLRLRLHAPPPRHARRGDRQVTLSSSARHRHPRVCDQRGHPRRARAASTSARAPAPASASSPRPSARRRSPSRSRAARRSRCRRRRTRLRRTDRQLRARGHDRRPVLHPEAEAVDGLALFTKAIEALGLVAALDLFCGGRLRAVALTERNNDMNTSRPLARSRSR